MADLEAQTTFTITDPPAEYEETLDLILLPENAGTAQPGNCVTPRMCCPP